MTDEDLLTRMKEARYFLNFRQEGQDCDYADLIDEAVDEIESLKARIEELEGALRPFSDFANRFGDTARDDSWQITQNPSGNGNLTMGDCRTARATLQPKAGS
jgi:hypothetical protein